jgi:RNA polymerase sigma-70 factor (ECF subfamily)
MADRIDEATDSLEQLVAGDARAADRLLPLVYEELRALAAGQLRSERPDHTLQPTALVHEAYLRLVHCDRIEWRSRAHFLAIAATTLRRILIDHARERGAQRRGGGMSMQSLEGGEVSVDGETSLLEFEDVLSRLAAVNARQARIVELRYIGGMTLEEAAVVLDEPVGRVQADWRFARAWLKRELERAAHGR